MVQRTWIWTVVIFTLINTIIFYNRTVAPALDPSSIPVLAVKNPLISTKVCNRTYIYEFNGDWGFGSELNNFYFCVVYAARSDRTLVINDTEWNYGSYWDIFEDVLPDCEIHKTFHAEHSRDLSSLEDRKDHIWTYRYWDGMWGYFQRPNNSIPAEEIRAVAHRLFVLKPDIMSKVLEQTATVAPHEGDYIGTHIRRGDKHAEDPPFEVIYYVERLDLMIAEDPVIRLQQKPNVFVASDDIQVFTDLQQLRPNWNVLFVNTSHHHGHSQWHFNQASKAEQMSQAIHLLAELEMLKQATQVLCTYTSNICTLLQILRSQPPETVDSLDRQRYGFLGHGFYPNPKYVNTTTAKK